MKIFIEKAFDIIWSIIMTISAIRKYGLYGAKKHIDDLLARERMKYFKRTGKRWKNEKG